MHERKDQLVDLLVDYLLEHGLNDLSLRPMAAAAGTSARLLIYHFGSKEALLAEVLERMQVLLRQSFAEMFEFPHKGRKEEPLMIFWRWAIAPKNYPYLKLLYELQILAVQTPSIYGAYLQRSSEDWLDLAKAMLPENERDDAMASMVIAVFDGLFLELMSTGDRSRTTAALKCFITTVKNARRTMNKQLPQRNRR